jgi:transposase
MDKRSTAAMTVGLDLGDRFSSACALDSASGEVKHEWRMPTTRQGLARYFAGKPPMRIALEVGAHSPWVSRLLASWGHEVLIANPRRVRLIAHNRRKSDRFDCRTLARLARLDPELLAPVHHRNAACQHDLAILRARAALVRARTLLVNHLRGAVKSAGGRLPKCSAASLSARSELPVPEALRPTSEPLLAAIGELSEQIRGYDHELETVAERYPDSAALRQIAGVGTLTSLAFILTLEDPARFRDSRQVGAYLGLVPGTRQSGACDPQMHITKEGDPFLRQLLVQAAHYILGPFGPDCDLRRHGLRLTERGGKAAKKRAAVAVARKLAVLLHRLWLTQHRYEPLRESPRKAANPGIDPVASFSSPAPPPMACGRPGSRPPTPRPASAPPTGPAATGIAT